MADSANTDSDWTNYNRFLERFLYKKNTGEPKLFDH
jgi:hypothetical protein